MSDEKDQDDIPFDNTVRNGVITAIGVILGFALSLLKTQNTSAGLWSWKDIPGLLLLILGILVLTVAISQLLAASLTLKSYNRTIKIIIAGIVLVFVSLLYSVTLNVVNDFRKAKKNDAGLSQPIDE